MGLCIVVKDNEGENHTYQLRKFARSNASICINQRPIVEVGEKVEKGDILADGPSMQNGELALGQTLLSHIQHGMDITTRMPSSCLNVWLVMMCILQST